MNKNVYLGVKGVGILIGAVALITLISRHPVHVSLIALGAAVYFIADYLSKH